MPNEYSRRWFEAFLDTIPERTISGPRPGVSTITNNVTARLHSEVEYEDGRRDVFDFERLHPDVLSERAARIGFEVLERCCSWTEGGDPDPREPRYQLVLARRSGPPSPRTS